MRLQRPHSRWRAALWAVMYLLAIGIIGGGVLAAVGILFLMSVGLFLAGGFLTIFLGLALFALWNSTGGRRASPR